MSRTFEEANATKLYHVWLLLVLPALLLAVILFSYAGLTQLDLTDPRSQEAIRKALPYLIALNHSMVFFILLLVLKKRKESWASIGWDGKYLSASWPQELAIGLAAALALYLFKEFAIDSIRALLAGNRPTFTTLFNFQPDEVYLPMAVVATTFIAVEESVYRGFAIPRLGKKYGTAGAVLLSTLFFALLHWGNGPFALLSSFLLGLLFALIFLWRGHLLAVTVAHAGVNGLMLMT